MEQSLRTNRDLYLAIERLIEEQRTCERTLEEYLLALLSLAMPYAARPVLSLAEFYALISAAFPLPPLPFDNHWRQAYETLSGDETGYPGWRATLIRQIVDLREMAEEGSLASEHRYFGIDAPRGSRWYNFDPLTFLECGMTGSFGGWEPDEASGRILVPGPVAVLNPDGSFGVRNPEEIENPVFVIPEITWHHFKDFIQCGQWYE